MVDIEKLKEGDMVHYAPEHYRRNNMFENGLVKRITPDRKAVFVVYNCNKEWHRYRDYTAARTNPEDLFYGWRESDGDNK